MDLPAPPPAWTSWMERHHPGWGGLVAAAVDGLPTGTVPPRPAIFRAFAVDPAAVRVLVLGQDPYPTPGHAMGLSFSVPPGTAPLPPSLVSILAEVRAGEGSCAVRGGDLTPWTTQGVLLLNTWLTLDGPGDRRRAAWQAVTAAVVRALVRHAPQPLAVLAWGRPAILAIGELPPTPAGPRLLLRSSHPSPLGARRPCQGHPPFVGCRHFTRVNAWLREQRYAVIRW